MSETAGKPNSA